MAPSVTVTRTFPPTSTATIIPASTRTPTPTPTLAPPTWTPLPTLPPAQAMDYALELLQTNAGCRLPCWWGFTPGRTSWHTARHSLAQLGSSIYIDTQPINSRFYIQFFVPGENDPFPIAHEYLVQDGIIQGIKLYTYGLAPAYYLAEFLKTYGPPDEVWIRAYFEDQGNLPFGVALFYSHLGILAEYYPNGEQIGDSVVGCPQESTAPFLGVWATEIEMTFEEANKSFGAYVEVYPPFLPLEEATQMNIATFYQTFKQPNNPICLETEASRWFPN